MEVPFNSEKTSTRKKITAQQCPICSSSRFYYAFSSKRLRVLQCFDCRFCCLSPDTARGLTNISQRKPLIFSASPRCQNVVEASQELLSQFYGFESIKEKEDFGFFEISGTIKDLAGWQTTDQNDEFKELVVFFYRKTFASAGNPNSNHLSQGEFILSPHTASNLIFKLGYNPLGFNKRPSPESLPDQKFSATEKEEVCVFLASKRNHARPLISVVVPVYNEERTISKVVDSLINLEFSGADVEVVLVESNSSDRSREIVNSYSGRKNVKIVLEEKPSGKGHAVRCGIKHATGDIFIIQDADLEYDIEDYHALVSPIIQGQEAFVLGSRHGGRNNLKLRNFQRPFLSFFYNMAHILVTFYINKLFGLRLKDPQTMFKVFRRDCIEGLQFQCNYFDFDYELLIKIVRKGFKPIEVPVNYNSRSHAEGKKIRMWRDAPLGLFAITKLKFTPLKSFLKIGEPIPNE
ncbi:MAG: glycosyltransferase family 2 protein [Verrucomicrobia bacterium]|nr:glycosyltransferase family 2 protein [Verrucomicrobiota bacterium]